MNPAAQTQRTTYLTQHRPENLVFGFFRVSTLFLLGQLRRWELYWRSDILGMSGALGANPIACLREGSGGWHYGATARGNCSPWEGVMRKSPWKMRLREKQDNTRKLTLCVWSAASLTSSGMSEDQEVETVLISITWLAVLNPSLFLSHSCPGQGTEKDLCSFVGKFLKTASSVFFFF